MKVRNVLVVDFIVTKESRDIRFGKLKVEKQYHRQLNGQS